MIRVYRPTGSLWRLFSRVLSVWACDRSCKKITPWDVWQSITLLLHACHWGPRVRILSSIVATLMKRSFPVLRFHLLVGIGAGCHLRRTRSDWAMLSSAAHLQYRNIFHRWRRISPNINTWEWSMVDCSKTLISMSCCERSD